MNRAFGFLAGAVLAAVSASAATYHVETTGNDNNDGSSGSPFATIAKALTVATTEGDVIEVGEGTFPVQTELAVSVPIAITGAGRGKTIVCRDTSVAKTRIFNVSAAATIEKLTVKGGYLEGGGDYGCGVLLKSGGILRDCEICNCDYKSWTGGIGAGVHADGQGTRVENCVFHDNDITYSGTGTALGLSNYAVADRCLIYDNRASYGTAMVSISQYGTLSNSTITRNVCNAFGTKAVQNGHAIVTVANNGNHKQYVTNCVIALNTGWYPQKQSLGNLKNGVLADGFTVAGNLTCVTDNCTDDPDFVDYENGDFRLSPGSPAVGKGCFAYDDAAVAIGFRTTVREAVKGADVVFTATRQNCSGTLVWDFGDGSAAVESDVDSVSHAYQTCGKYTVTATLKGTQTSLTRANYVSVFPKTLYVDPASTDATEPYETRETAAKYIEDALAWAVDGSEIVIVGSPVAKKTTDRIVVQKNVTIRSEDGDRDGCIVKMKSDDTGTFLLHSPLARIENLTVQANSKSGNDSHGLGFYIDTQGGLVTNCVIRNGVGTGYGSKGAGVYMRAGLVTHCVISNCTGSGTYGGSAAHMTGGRLANSLVCYNMIDAKDSACGTISLDKGGEVVNCTVAKNTAGQYAGFRISGTAPKVVNCLIAENTSTGIDGPAGIQAGVYNDGAECFTACAAPLKINDTCFTGTLGLKQPESGDFHLTVGSVCIDNGTLEGVTPPASDLDGNVRVDESGKIDIGCYELKIEGVQAAIACGVKGVMVPGEVTYTASVAGADPTTLTYFWDIYGDGSEIVETTVPTVTCEYTRTGNHAAKLVVRKGTTDYPAVNTVAMFAYPKTLYVDAASATPTEPYDQPSIAAKTIAAAYALAGDGSTIIVAPGSYSVSASLTVEKAVTICGQTGEPEDVVLTRSGNTLRPFLINHPDATVSGMTMTGFASNGNYDYGHAAYIDVKGGTVTNCVIRNCTSHNWGALGGAVYMIGPGLVTHCVISNCTASTHGNGGSAVYMTKGTVRNTLMVNNSYPSTETGAANWGTIYMTGGTVENCTLAGNSSRASCAGIWSAGGTVRNCVLVGNTTSSAIDSLRAWAGTAENFSHCVTDTEAINATCAKDTAPFVSVGTGNYRLAPGGVAVDFAETLGWMTGGTDLDGNDRIRGDAPDAGCYEAEAGVFSASVKALGPTEGFVPFSVGVQATPVFGSDKGYTLKWYDGAATEPFLVTKELTFTFTANEPGRHNLKLTIIDDETEAEFTTDSPLPLFAAPKTMYVAAKDETVASADPYATPETAAPDLATAYGAAMAGTTIVMKRGVHEAKEQLVMKKVMTVTGETDNPEDTRFHYRGSDNRLFYADADGIVIRNLAMDGKHRGGGNYPGKANHIYANAFCTVSNCVMRNGQCFNWGYYAAAIYLKDGLITHCVITNNYTDAKTDGVAGTSKEDAKGIAVHMRAGRIDNCLVAYNYCGGGTKTSNNGGAIYLAGGEVVNCTVVSNTYPGCAGVYAEGGRVVNTIIANNVSTGAGGEASVWRGDISCFDHCVSDTLAVDGRIVCGDLRFRNVAKGDWRIRSSSVAKDCGDDAVVNESADLSGRSRRIGRVDAGCYENQSGGLSVLVR